MIKNEEHISQYGWMRNLGLKKIDLNVYAMIHSYTFGKGNYTGSIKHIAEFYGYERRAIERSIKRLEEMNLIKITRREGETSSIEAVFSHENTRKIEQEHTTKSRRNLRQKVAGTYDKKSHNNTNNNTNNIISKKNLYNQFPQNEYDYEQLEKELLNN